MNLSLLLVFIIATQGTINAKYIGQDRLNSGQCLDHGDCLVSVDKRFYLCMQDDGNLVIYKGADANHRSAIWASHTHGKGSHPHSLKMQNDGNLVVYDSQGHPTWASGTHGRGATDVSMIMQSDGNLVIYNNSPTAPLWASNTQSSSDVDCQRDSWPHDWTERENEVFSLVNQIRAKGASCGGRWRSPVSSIKKNSKLTRAARCHAVDMALHNYFDHVDQQGGTIGKRIKEVGYHYGRVAENIAKGQSSLLEVVNSWMNSPDHCHAIMTDYQDIGIAYIGENYYKENYIWVQNFGTLL